MTRIIVAIVLIALCARSLPAQRGFVPPVTKSLVEFARSANPPTQIEWSADGKSLGYLAHLAGGKPQLLIIDAATGRSEALVVPDSVKYFHWAPSGSALLLAGDKQLNWLSLSSKQLTPLVAGTDPIADAKLSPDGRWVSYLYSHNLFLLNPAGGAPRPLTNGGAIDSPKGELDHQYSNAFGLSTAYWWSPDSSAIAYLETDWPAGRHFVLPGGALPKMRLFIAHPNLPNQESREFPLDDTSPYVTRLNWLPDSRHFAFERLNREQNEIQLIEANAANFESHLLLAEHDLYWINLPNDLYLFKDGKRFLWSSESTGYRHLYLYSTEGTLLRRITQGHWQINTLSAVDEEHNTVYFTGTLKSALESQLYRTSLADSTSEIVPITKAEGWHIPLFSPHFDRFADTYSTVTTPPRVDLLSSQGDSMAAISKAPVEQQPRPEFLTITLHDKTPLAAMMIKPPDFDPNRKYPVIAYTYDGPDGRVVQNAWGGWPTVWHQFMAKRGFIVLAVDTRGSHGYSHLFEEPLHYRFGAREMADVREVASYLRGLPFVDPNRLGLWGSGYGGYVVVSVMLDYPEGFKLGFADSPATDWTLSSALFTEKYLGSLPKHARSYDDSDAFDHAWSLRGRLLIAANMDDPETSFEHVLALQKQLLKKYKSADVMVFPAADHLNDPIALATLLQRMTAFFSDL